MRARLVDTEGVTHMEITVRSVSAPIFSYIPPKISWVESGPYDQFLETCAWDFERMTGDGVAVFRLRSPWGLSYRG